MQTNKITPKTIRELIRDVFGIDIRSKSRHTTNMAALKAYVILTRKHTPSSLSEIGKEIGRGHSNIVHHLKGADFYHINYPWCSVKMKTVDAILKSTAEASRSIDTNALQAIREMSRMTA